MNNCIFQGVIFQTAICLALVISSSGSALADPFKLGATEQGYLQQQQQAQMGYPAPQMVQPYAGSATLNQPMMRQQDMYPQRYNPPPQYRPPLQAQVSVTLPPEFLGAWSVQGQRGQVDAMPEFQKSANRAFAQGTNNIWQINGSPQQGYSMASNTGIQTPLVIDKIENGTAFFHYQHPIGNTTAQEEVVMKLLPGGRQFQGLERISIVKQGMPQPRARVSYSLFGQRQ